MSIEHPLRCLAFSPNWVFPQICVLLADNQIAYGSNNDIFLINFKEK